MTITESSRAAHGFSRRVRVGGDDRRSGVPVFRVEPVSSAAARRAHARGLGIGEGVPVRASGQWERIDPRQPAQGAAEALPFPSSPRNRSATIWPMAERLRDYSAPCRRRRAGRRTRTTLCTEASFERGLGAGGIDFENTVEAESPTTATLKSRYRRPGNGRKSAS